VSTTKALVTVPATFRDDRVKLGSLLELSLRVFLQSLVWTFFRVCLVLVSVLVCLVLWEQYDLDLCNVCDELWSDDHNYIKFLIKLASLVKLGVIYFNFTVSILPLFLSFYHDLFQESHLSNRSDGEHHVWIRDWSARSAMLGEKQQLQPRSLAESAAPGATSRDGAVSHREDSAANQYGEHYQQHASPDEPSSTTTTTS
jgi:hypothetical protein